MRSKIASALGGKVIGGVKRLRQRAVGRLLGPDVTGRIRRLETHQVSMLESIRRLEKQVFARPYVNSEFTRARDVPDGAFDYEAFEEKFRGPPDAIRQQLRFYVPLLAGRGVVIDLGCGRGELLEVLGEAGIPARGVEIHPGQARTARAKGLEVIEADLLEYLGTLPDGAQDVIISTQVIEHVPLAALDRLLGLAFRKLRAGGLFIAETVNVHSTAAFKFFYLDPTHHQPLFPEVLQLMCESKGFRRIEIVYPRAPTGSDPERLYHDCGEFAVVAEK